MSHELDPAARGADGGDAPLQSGVVVAVCVGPGGIPKQPVPSARVLALGLEGDAHRFRLHGGANRAVCVFSVEDYAALQRDGVDVEPPGAFGENLTTEGLDNTQLRPGMRLRVGAEVVLEIFDVREPCGTLKSIDRRFPNLMVGRSGWMCRVLTEGVVTVGDTITALRARP
ncbi:MAG: MOSC domain-containing protein [Planctomycetota bacterium]